MKIFTTEIIKELQEKLKSGKKLKRTENIFYQGDVDLKKKDIAFKYTNEEMIEFAKCYSDKIYFIEEYCGVKLRKFQKEVIQHYEKNRFNIFARSHHIGFSKTMALIYLWEILFTKTGFVIVYIDNKNKGTIEIINHVKRFYQELPFFLKPGIKKYEQKVIIFDNGSRFIVGTTYESGLGFSYDVLAINDFAFMTPNKVNNIYNTHIPAISARRNTKLIISSAFNGNNMFYDLYTNSILGENHPNKNMYKSMRIPYTVIEGRDSEWKNREIELLGNEEFSFQQKYEVRPITLREKKFRRILNILKE